MLKYMRRNCSVYAHCPYENCVWTTMQFPTNALSHRPTLLHYIMDGRIKVPSLRLDPQTYYRVQYSVFCSTMSACVDASLHSLENTYCNLTTFMHAGKPPAGRGT